MKNKLKKQKWFVICGLTVMLIVALVIGTYIIHIPPAVHIRNNCTITTLDGDISQSLIYTTYTTANFTINYPADWTVIPRASKIPFVSKTGYEGGYITLDIQLLSSSESGGIYNSVDDVMMDLVQRFLEDAKNVSDVCINYEKEEEGKGAKGKEVSISYVLHNINYTQTQIIAKKGKYFYVLTYHAPSAYYGGQEKVYEYAKKHWMWK
ncbi:hypothetical protein C5S39_00610 [Candidatus Methanophagaceae archaeon]|nr:hypothetical protein C5S39_00610 [Methanophagales archaeon]